MEQNKLLIRSIKYYLDRVNYVCRKGKHEKILMIRDFSVFFFIILSSLQMSIYWKDYAMRTMKQ